MIRIQDKIGTRIVRRSLRADLKQDYLATKAVKEQKMVTVYKL